MFSKTALLALALGALAATAAPSPDTAALSPEISEGVGVVTWSGTGCKGQNQGTTLVYRGNTKCVNWSNAGSVDFQLGTFGPCDGGSQVIFYHNTGCAGASYATTGVPYGCQNLNAVAGGHGSGKIICKG